MLPIDVLKIDRAFMNEVLTDKKVQMIVKAVIQLAHDLDILVLAEGMETKQQVEFMDQMGCDTYQGFYFGSPVPYAAFQETWLPFLQ